jgi:hypothetical protein
MPAKTTIKAQAPHMAEDCPSPATCDHRKCLQCGGTDGWHDESGDGCPVAVEEDEKRSRLRRRKA